MESPSFFRRIQEHATRKYLSLPPAPLLGEKIAFWPEEHPRCRAHTARAAGVFAEITRSYRATEDEKRPVADGKKPIVLPLALRYNQGTGVGVFRGGPPMQAKACA